MKCPNCKNEIPNDSKFCPDCGAQIVTTKDKKTNAADLEIERLKRELAEKDRLINSQEKALERESNKPSYVTNMKYEGDIYSGFVYNGRPHGWGKMTTTDTDDTISIEGEFINGLPHGEMYMKITPHIGALSLEGRCNDEGDPIGVWKLQGTSSTCTFTGTVVPPMVDIAEGTIVYYDGRQYVGQFSMDSNNVPVPSEKGKWIKHK